MYRCKKKSNNYKKYSGIYIYVYIYCIDKIKNNYKDDNI